MKNNGWIATKKEHVTYNIFWLGQNILWGFVSNYLASYLNMGLGIDPLKAAAVLIGPRIWDAVNDTLFGYIVDKYRFKNGQQFMPWIKIGTFGIGVVGIVLFAIPKSLADTAKIIWFVLAYMIFDALYTFLDAPAFSMSTVMTDNIQERTEFISGNKLFAMIGGIIATVAVSGFIESVGWLGSAVIFCGIGFVFMIPYLFCGKERRIQTEKEKEESFSFKQMFSYLKTNKYLIACLISFLLFGMTSFEQPMSLYVAKVCFGAEGKQMFIAACAALPVLLVAIVVPVLAKKYDKFYILLAGLAFSAIVSIVAIFVGCKSFILSIVFVALKCIGFACWQVIIYMLVADTTEYGTYKSGVRATGITFSLQTFISKMNSALVNSFMLFCISFTGYDALLESQTAEVITKIWNIYIYIPAIGYVLGIIILVVFYKLRVNDVQIMAKYNNGEISYEEANAELGKKFGTPFKR